MRIEITGAFDVNGQTMQSKSTNLEFVISLHKFADNLLCELGELILEREKRRTCRLKKPRGKNESHKKRSHDTEPAF